MTGADLLRHLFQNSTCIRMSFILEVDHRSPMIMGADRSDETDDGSRLPMGHDPLKVSKADRTLNDLCEHHGARRDAVGHSDILPYCLKRDDVSLIHISEPTRQAEISYAVFC